MMEKQAKILYINEMQSEKPGFHHRSVHFMFDDGSIVKVEAEADDTADPELPASMEFIEKIISLLGEYETSGDEVYPICLGDIPCMYCGGKGCINCQRK
jgi:hypothetical protein